MITGSCIRIANKGIFLTLSLLLVSDSAAQTGSKSLSGTVLQRSDRDFFDPLPDFAVSRLGSSCWRHQDTITLLAFSPDGMKLASASHDQTIRLWDVKTGRELRVFRSQNGGAEDLGFTGDGKLLISGEADGSIVFWNVRSGERVRQYQEPKVLNSVSLSPDGKTLAVATGSHLHAIRVLAASSGELQATLTGHEASVHQVRFSADSKILASASIDKTIRLWDVHKRTEIHKFQVADRNNAAVFSSDGKLLFGLSGNEIYMWEVAGRTERHRFKGADHEYFSFICVSPGGGILAAGDEKGTVHFWDVATHKESHSIGPLGAIPVCGAFSPDAKVFASVYHDRTIGFWDVRSGKEFFSPQGHRAKIDSAVFSPDGKIIVTGGVDDVRAWDLNGAKGAYRIAAIGRQTPPAISRNGKWLTWGSMNEIAIGDIITGNKIRSLKNPGIKLSRVEFSPDDTQLVLLASDGTIRLWDFISGRQKLKLVAGLSCQAEYDIAFSPDGGLLALGAGVSRDSESFEPVRLWETKTGKQVGKFKCPPSPLECLVTIPSADTLVSAHRGCSEGMVICHWDIPTGRELWRFAVNNPLDAAFSADGRILASRGTETIELWEVDTGLMIGELKCPNSSKCFSKGCLVFSSADYKLATALNGECSMLVWDVGGFFHKGQIKSKEIEKRDRSRLWEDLASTDASKAYLAIWELMKGKEQTLAFLRNKLTPVVPVNQDRVMKLIHELDDRSFGVRENAASELKSFKELAEPALRKALEDGLSLDSKRQFSRIIEELGPLCSQRLQSIRSVVVLELMNEKEGNELLEKLAKGAPNAWLTRQAKGALNRLKSRQQEGSAP